MALFICEGCAKEVVTVDLEEWTSLRDKIITDEDRGIMNIADKNCTEIPYSWMKMAETEHLILWKEKWT